MSLPVIIRPEAQEDILEARDWYERQRAGLGDSFVGAVEQICERVQAMPELYAAVLRNVRRGKLRKFPYVLYYRVLVDRIEVIAVLHASRRSRVWQDRA